VRGAGGGAAQWVYSRFDRKAAIAATRCRQHRQPGLQGQPYPFYARLRAEAPVHRVTLPDGRTAWLVTRYDDVATVLKDERFAKDPTSALTAQQLGRLPWMPAFFSP